MRSASAALILSAIALLPSAVPAQQPAFVVATIRPSATSVQFEHDGATDFLPDGLRMRDVTVATCIKLAYSVQNKQIAGPGWLDSDHFDILTRTEGPATKDQMKVMLRALLADRFHLAFHHEPRELRALVLTLDSKGGKLKPAADPNAPSFRENSANGTVARSMPIQEFADFLAQPLAMPIVDQTGLAGKYDFTLDFTPYLPEAGKNMDGTRMDTMGIVKAAMQDQLGVKMDTRKTTVDVLVIDHVDKPTDN